MGFWLGLNGLSGQFAAPTPSQIRLHRHAGSNCSKKRVKLPKLETALPEFWEIMAAVAIINET
jgi:hypothetical protein